MNIEDFFIEKYMQLEKENKQLMETVQEEKREFGVFPSVDNLKLVRVSHVSSWNMNDGIFKGKTSQELKQMKSKIDDAFNWNVNYGKAITVEEQIFPFSFWVNMPGKTIRYAVDENGEVVKIDKTNEPKLSKWCNAELREGLKEMAKQVLLEEMEKRIERLRKDEEKEK